MEETDVTFRRRRADSSGRTVVDIVFPGRSAVCPYFHQRMFTPDSRRFICGVRMGGHHEVVVVDRNEERAWRLTHGGAHAHTSDLGPDGRTLYVATDGVVRALDVLSGSSRDVKRQTGNLEIERRQRIEKDGTEAGPESYPAFPRPTHSAAPSSLEAKLSAAGV